MDDNLDQAFDPSLQQSIDEIFQSRSRTKIHDQLQPMNEFYGLAQPIQKIPAHHDSSSSGAEGSMSEDPLVPCFPKVVRSKLPKVYSEDDSNVGSVSNSALGVPLYRSTPAAMANGKSPLACSQTQCSVQSRTHQFGYPIKQRSQMVPGSPFLQGISRFAAENREVLHSHELAVDQATPLPGACHVLNDKDSSEERVPAEQLSTRLSIICPSDAPLHIQMLSYAQLWACWAATIDDIDRRSEVLDWVTKRMEEAWKFGIANGHYPTNGARRKRSVDTSKQIAPFAWEKNSGKPQYAIINAELEAAKVSFDMINARVDSQELQEGSELLSHMQNVLNRQLLMSDWTTLKPRFFAVAPNSRNLFMFALWELQERQRQIRSLEKQLENAKSGPAQRHLQNRVEIFMERADQHAALAIELNLKDPVAFSEDDQGEEGEDENAENIEQASSTNQPDAETAVEASTEESVRLDSILDVMEVAPSNEDGVIADNEGECDNISTGSKAQLGSMRKPYIETDTDPSTGAGRDSLEVHTEQEVSNSVEDYVPVQDYLVGDKRPFVAEAGVDCQIKKPRIEVDHHSVHEYSPVQEKASSPINLLPDAHDTTPPTQCGTKFPLFSDPEAISYNQDAAQGQSSMLSPSPNTYSTPSSSEGDLKRLHLSQVWQPKINAMLQQTGQPPRYIARYTDVRNALADMGYDIEQRNMFAREFQQGLSRMANSSRQASSISQSPIPARLQISQPQYMAPVPPGRHHSGIQDYSHPSPHAPPSNTINPAQIFSPPPKVTAHPSLVLRLPVNHPHDLDEYSEKNVNSSKGFSFRCLPFASIDQRRRLDELAGDYLTALLSDNSLRNKRFGKYIVIHDPDHPTRMPIGHGFWDGRKNSRADDSEWFYNGEPVPTGFDLDASHIHGPSPLSSSPASSPEPEASTAPVTPKLSFKIVKRSAAVAGVATRKGGPVHSDHKSLPRTRGGRNVTATSIPQRSSGRNAASTSTSIPAGSGSGFGRRVAQRRRQVVEDSDEEWTPNA